VKNIRLLLPACLALVLVQSALIAGKPAPPPPPPPPNPFLIYEWRPDLGGWLDKERNLIWGYSMNQISGSSYSYDYALGEVADYAGVLADGALDFDAKSALYDSRGDEYLAKGDAEPDPVLKQQYYDRAQGYYDLSEDYGIAADELILSAEVASHYSNWRLPTKDEFTDAFKKRFFAYGETELNAWDTSPLPGLQMQTTYYLYWTSTADKGGRYQWSVDPPTGTLQSVLKERSYIFAVPVRNYTP
jgi:hypothetical protein